MTLILDSVIRRDEMMRERELSNLMIQAGLERGMDVEQVVDELLALPVPSFVDPQLFRGSLLAAVEAHLLAQVADRMRRLRQQVGLEPRAAETTRVEALTGTAPTILDVDAGTKATIQSTGRPPDDRAVPGDATMVWQTYHGKIAE